MQVNLPGMGTMDVTLADVGGYVEKFGLNNVHRYLAQHAPDFLNTLKAELGARSAPAAGPAAATSSAGAAEAMPLGSRRVGPGAGPGMSMPLSGSITRGATSSSSYSSGISTTLGSGAAGNYEFPEIPYHDGRGYVFPAPCKGSRVLKTSDDTEAYIAEALKSYKKAGCAVGQQPGAFWCEARDLGNGKVNMVFGPYEWIQHH